MKDGQDPMYIIRTPALANVSEYCSKLLLYLLGTRAYSDASIPNRGLLRMTVALSPSRFTLVSPGVSLVQLPIPFTVKNIQKYPQLCPKMVRRVT